jgi:CrcB protein
MTRWLTVGAGGFIGAITRYAIAVWIDSYWRRPFPLATFAINVSGCFLIGLLLSLAFMRTPDPTLRLLLATGFLGAYTTFSTFELETNNLTVAGATGWAAANVIASVVAGFAAVRLGTALARLLTT